MKKVILLGDSMRIGYEPFVREALQGEADVWAPPENGRDTAYTLVGLGGWMKAAGGADADVVHFNCGHWDAAHWAGDPESLMPPDAYGRMLERITLALRRLCPRAQLIFALSTPMHPEHPECDAPRTTEELRRLNAAARDVMARLGVPVNDLFSLMEHKPASYYCDYAHFTEQGFRLLALQVAGTIRRYL